MNKKLIYVGFSFPHHGKHAGYDKIKNYISYDLFIDCQKNYDIVFKTIQKRTIISRLYGRLFRARLWFVELKLILHSFLNSRKYIYHIVYGENIYKYFGFLKFGNEIVITLHQPVSFFKSKNQKFFMYSLKNVDKIIVMSYEMEVFFKKKFPKKDIMYIPHGVDCNYFTPTCTKNNTVLMVGSWLRDFQFANNTFSYLKELNSNIRIIIIANENNNKYFIGTDIEFKSNISDNELLLLYQESKIVFLPLIQFTANNALLEAKSCGCKVIVSTHPQNFIDDNTTKIIFVDNDIENASDCIIKNLKNFQEEEAIYSHNNIRNKYGWDIIAKLTSEFITK